MAPPSFPASPTARSLVVSGEVSPEAVARFGDGGFADADAALAAFDEAAEAVATGYALKADKVSGASAEVLTASAGLARDKGLRAAVSKGLGSGSTLLESVAAATDQFVDIFTAMGGLMAERATDLRDIERRVVAHLVGEPEPGVPEPDEPSVLVAEDLAPVRHRRSRPGDGAGAGHRARRRRPATPRSSRGSSASRAWSAWPAPSGSPPVPRCSSTGPSAPSRRAPTPTRPGPGSRPTGSPARSWRPGPARPSPSTARRVKLLANVADGESARQAATAPVEGVGLFRTELCFLNRQDEPDVEEQAEIYAEVLDAFKGDKQYVVVRTLDAGSDKPIAFATHEGEENPALGVRGLRLAFGNPALLEHQLDGIQAAARAVRHHHLGDGADGRDRGRGRRVRREGPQPRARRRAS